VHLAEHCNLNCAYCDHFSPLAEKEFLDIKLFENDLERFSHLTNKKLGQIHLMGGEPLLHPQVAEFMDLTRKYFDTVTRIVLITNGILLHKQPKEFWESAKNNGVIITISPYPIKIATEKIRELSVKYSVGIIYDRFLGGLPKSMCNHKMDINGKGDIGENFLRCSSKNNCLALKKGKLYPCSRVPHSEHFYRKFGYLKKCENDSIDIYKAKNERELSEFVSKPIPFCKFCNVAEAEYGLEWKQSKKEISEWT
jgi:sulfatase maturation enzyme AslB (radical SAM superfamily)